MRNIFGILCLIISRKGKHNEMQDKICVVYGEGAVTDQTRQKWFANLLGSIDILAK